MPSLHRHPLPIIFLGAMLSGCLSLQQPSPKTAAAHPKQSSSAQYIPVQRYGRYTLVEFDSAAAKQDLLLQVIDIDLPGTWSASVEDGLHYVLLRSGYRLCERTAEIAALFDLPLPAAHLRLGPIVLREALQMLAGPAWFLQTNEQHRQVCFIPVIKRANTNALQLTSAALETTP